MTRLQKVAVFNMALGVLALVLVTTLYGLTGSQASVYGMGILGATILNRWLFRGKGQPDWDERERKIGSGAAFYGYWVVWMLFATLACGYAGFVGYHTMLPVWYLPVLVLAGACLMIWTQGAVVLWVERESGSRAMRLTGACLLVVLLAAGIAAGHVLLARRPTVRFAGSHQADEWHVTTGGQVVAHSRVPLIRFPNDWVSPGTMAMPILLPYGDAKLVSATFDGEALQVHDMGQGKYELESPGKLVAASDMTVEVVWRVPLAALRAEPHPKWGPYRARLQSLIPTHSFRLKVVVDPDCGFEIVGGKGNRWTHPFWNLRGDGVFTTNRGSCSMCIQPVAARDNASLR